MTLNDQLIAALRTVKDPEIPVNIYDLGLIYDVQASPQGVVSVRMTLTAPNCPVADKIPAEVQRAILTVPGVSTATVELTFDPPWTPDLMTEVAQIELESMGIDPRRAKDSLGSRLTDLTVRRSPSPRSRGSDANSRD